MRIARAMSEKARRTSQKRILDVLEAVIQKPETASAAMLSQSLGIPLATVYRQLETLSEEKFILSGPMGTYRPGARLRSMVLNCLADEPHVTRRRAVMKKLSDDLGETVSLSVPNGTTLVYYDRVESHWPVQINLHVGDVLPLHCCASGKLYLSGFPRHAALEVFRNINPDRRAPGTIVEQRAFSEELDRIAVRGYALDDEEWFAGMVGAAVPIRNGRGTFCSCLSTHALISRKNLRQVDADIPAMQQAAQRLQQIFCEEEEEATPPITDRRAVS